MLDEGFLTDVYEFIIKIICKLGCHIWDRFDATGHVEEVKAIWDDSCTIEFYKCYNCGKEKMIWYDCWGMKHIKYLKK